MAEKLGIYIHIPFCRSKCDYCDFYSLAGQEERMDDYQKALLAHLKETAPQARGWQIDTVYFGGGTPSFSSRVMQGRAAIAILLASPAIPLPHGSRLLSSPTLPLRRRMSAMAGGATISAAI